MSFHAAGWDILGRAIGAPAKALVSALGEPVARRQSGDDLWLIFEAPGCRLRVRCDAAREGAEVASWTLSFEAGPPTLREAAEPLGLWPQVAPDVAAEESEGVQVLRAVGAAGRLHSLTARIGNGCIQKVTLFDEPPEWL